MKRHLVVPSRGVLVVSTDVHRSIDDFEALEAPEHAHVVLGKHGA